MPQYILSPSLSEAAGSEQVVSEDEVAMGESYPGGGSSEYPPEESEMDEAAAAVVTRLRSLQVPNEYTKMGFFISCKTT